MSSNLTRTLTLALIRAEEVLSVLDKIIGLTVRQPGTDIVKIAHWLRCLFKLTLDYDESISYKCTEQAINLATRYHGVSVTFNR